MNTVIEAQQLIAQVQSTARSGLMTDIDGTISRIAPHPDLATVEPEARETLKKLANRMTLVGAISGRGAIDTRELVGLDELVYSGNHGMEIWRNNALEQSPLALRYAPKIAELLKSLEITDSISGLYVENKGLTASIHFRGVDDPSRVESILLDEVREKAEALALRVTRGRMVVEIRPPVELSKGTSVNELIHEYRLESLVYLGDDVTDVDAFRALTVQRTASGGHFYGIGVENEGTPAIVRESADAMVDGVDGVIELLRKAAS